MLDKEVAQLLDSVPGKNFRVSVQNDVLRFEGTARLRRWEPDAVLRIAMANSNGLRIHVWSEQEGVILYWYPYNRPTWAAYRAARRPGEAAPAQGSQAMVSALLTTDDERDQRLLGRTYEVRCQDKCVVLTKGDVRLLTAPLAGPVKTVYLETPNDLHLRELALYRGGPAPDDPPVAPAAGAINTTLSDLEWKETLPNGTQFQRNEDGSVELIAEKTDSPAIALAPLPELGLQEMIFQVAEATYGTGLLLADKEGKPLDGIEFGREQKSGSMAFAYNRPDAGNSEPWLDANERPAEHSTGRQWLRLVSTAGVLRCWISPDGVHWGRVLDNRRPSGVCRQVGLFVRPAGDPNRRDYVAVRRIRLHSMRVSPLGGVMELVPGELLAKAAAAAMPVLDGSEPAFRNWQEKVAGSLPSGVAPAVWRMACAIQTLAAMTDPGPARFPFNSLVQSGLSQCKSPDDRLRLLRDAALICAPDSDAARRFMAHWEWLARETAVEGTETEFRQFLRSYATASIWEAPPEASPLSGDLARDRLLVLFAGQRWPEMLRWCQWLEFQRQCGEPTRDWLYEHGSLIKLVRWLRDRTAGRAKAGAPAGISPAPAMIAPLSRPAYNVLSELQAAADGKQYDDVFRLLVSTAIPRDDGLVPDPADSQHFTSFPLAVRQLMGRNAKLREAMQRQFRPADQLTVDQAIGRSDEPAVEEFRIRYSGTPAAAQACLWLGDRRMSSANVPGARACYEEGLLAASAQQLPQLAARVRLAHAMLGRVLGEPVKEPVDLGGSRVPAEEFEKWVAEIAAKQKSAGETPDPVGLRAGSVALSPCGLEAMPWGRSEDDAKRTPSPINAPSTAQGIDLRARYTTAGIAGDLLVLATHAQIRALEVGGGRPRWSCELGNPWSPSPLRPLIQDQRVYVRARASLGGAGVACLDLANGRTLWLRDCGGDAVCDPLMVRNRLYVLSTGPADGQPTVSLRVVELARESGEVLSVKPLTEVWSQSPGTALACQASVAGDRLAIVLAGSVLSVDLDGRIAWLRHCPVLPREIDPVLGQQALQPPIASDGLLYVHQPGLSALECLRSATGELVWRRPVAGLHRVLDFGEKRLLVETNTGLVALQTATGDVAWRRQLPESLDAYLRAQNGLILCAVRQPMENGQHCATFVWIDATTGEIRGRSPVVALLGPRPLVGPLVAAGNRLWCLAQGNVDWNQSRDPFELRPSGAVLTP